MSHRIAIASAVVAIATLLPLAARAIEFVTVHHCTCRLDGQDVELGQRRCLKTDAGSKAAVCVMEQNVTSWRPSGEECPQAQL